MGEQAIGCPKCGSSQVHADQRGWSYMTGFIGSGKILITCLRCGCRFKPGEGRGSAPKNPARHGGSARLQGVAAFECQQKGHVWPQAPSQDGGYYCGSCGARYDPAVHGQG